MSSNLDRLLARLKEQADLIDELNTRSDFRHKSDFLKKFYLRLLGVVCGNSAPQIQ
ncbi:MAG TPA: hypothetical protein V6D25_23115 [Leptolyngbyaceae cyanobacterium]